MVESLSASRSGSTSASPSVAASYVLLPDRLVAAAEDLDLDLLAGAADLEGAERALAVAVEVVTSDGGLGGAGGRWGIGAESMGEGGRWATCGCSADWGGAG